MRLTDTGVMLCGAALFVSANALGDDSAVPPPYQPFPAGYGYMEHVQALQQATNKGDRAIIREHGWKLWAGIMQPDAASGWPLWFTWPNTKGAFTATPAEIKEAGPSTSQTATLAVSMKQKSKSRSINVNTKGPVYPVPMQVQKMFPSAMCKSGGQITVCDGRNFVNNGDIMIPTESLSVELNDWIRLSKVYLAATLDKAHEQKVHLLNSP